MIRAVMFDFGGVLTTGPFEAFARYEVEHGLTPGLIRRLNSQNPDDNAWARFERGELDRTAFAAAFEAEATAAGETVDALGLLSTIRGDLRPEMLEAVRRCSGRFATACLTNNFAPEEAQGPGAVDDIFALFDVVLESRTLGVRKPEPRFYELACRALGVTPEQSVFLDDLGINLKPARAMGMRTIKVIEPAQALSELAALTGLALDDLVAGAGRGTAAGRPG
jgi:putative hydrolase of the HAD superfamily